MTDSSSTRGPSGEDLSETIPFGTKFTQSEQFKTVFREGMALVEETAAYLDGDGRLEVRADRSL